MSLFYRTDSEWTRDAHFKLQVRSREVISYEGGDNHLVHWSVRSGECCTCHVYLGWFSRWRFDLTSFFLSIQLARHDRVSGLLYCCCCLNVTGVSNKKSRIFCEKSKFCLGLTRTEQKSNLIYISLSFSFWSVVHPDPMFVPLQQ